MEVRHRLAPSKNHASPLWGCIRRSGVFTSHTNISGPSQRRGVNGVRQMTAKGRHARALAAVSEWCRRNRHLSLRDQHAHLSQMLRGHYAYYVISGNSRRIRWFNSVKRRTRVVRERAIEGEDRMLPKNEQSKPHEATTIPAAPVIMLTPAPEATVRPSSRISAAREAVREFLSTELGARETR